MSAPTQFKGRLNELLAKVRLQSQAATLSGSNLGSGGIEKQQLDPFWQQDIKNVLKQQQEGIQALVNVMKEDLADMAKVTEQLENEAKKKQKQF